MQFQQFRTPFTLRLEGKSPNIVSYLPAIEEVSTSALDEVLQTLAKDGKLWQIIAVSVGGNAFMLLYQNLH